MITEAQFVEFVLSRCRSNDYAFIKDFFESQEFLGPTIQKEYKRFYQGFLELDDLMGELYLELSKENWDCIAKFKGQTSFVAWVRLIARNFFIGLRKKNKVFVPIVERFDLDSPFATDTDRIRLIEKISDPPKRTLLKIVYIDRLSKTDALMQMNISSMSELNRLHNEAVKDAKNIAASDEFTRLIFIYEDDTQPITIGYEDWMSHSEDSWISNTEIEEMKTVVKVIISKWKSKQQRIVVEKRLLEGKSSFQIAKELGLTEGNVYDYFSKGYKRLIREVRQYKNNI